jgi:hypothetical protein
MRGNGTASDSVCSNYAALINSNFYAPEPLRFKTSAIASRNS